jgi:hypothetical protein
MPATSKRHAVLSITRGDGTPIVSQDEAAHLTDAEVVATLHERLLLMPAQGTRHRRVAPTLKQIAAAAIVTLLKLPHRQAQEMTSDEIIRLVEKDHYPVPYAIARDLGWPPDRYNHPSNLELVAPIDHAKKTAKVDTPQVAKSKRITTKHEDFRRKMLAKTEPDCDVVQTAPRKAKIPTRGFQKYTRVKTPRFVPPQGD